MSIGGTAVKADLQRINNELVVSIGKTKVVFGALNSDGTSKGLSSTGSIDLSRGDLISVRVEGFEPEADVQFWLFSTPRLLNSTKANDAGRIASEVAIPDDVSPGDHRFVLSSTNSDGDQVNLAVGINLQTNNAGDFRWGVLLAFVVLGTGALAAFFLPAVLRRRNV